MLIMALLSSDWKSVQWLLQLLVDHSIYHTTQNMTSLTASSGAAPLFHLVPTQVWNELPTGETYFPATYANDGFTNLFVPNILMFKYVNVS